MLAPATVEMTVALLVPAMVAMSAPMTVEMMAGMMVPMFGPLLETSKRIKILTEAGVPRALEPSL